MCRCSAQTCVEVSCADQCLCTGAECKPVSHLKDLSDAAVLRRLDHVPRLERDMMPLPPLLYEQEQAISRESLIAKAGVPTMSTARSSVRQLSSASHARGGLASGARYLLHTTVTESVCQRGRCFDISKLGRS